MAGCSLEGIRRRRQWAPDARALGAIGDRWMLLIVRELAFGPKRLAELQRAFPGLSTGALEQRLARMADAGLITRERHAEAPPRVEFELTASGRELVAILGPVVRWALRWAWSAPGEDEWVDVTALFRLAGCVVAAPPEVRGEVELIVEDEAGVAVDLYTLALGGGGASVTRRPAARADAVITGTPGAWAAALGPGEGAAPLRVRGERQLADVFLGSFRATAPEVQ